MNVASDKINTLLKPTNTVLGPSTRADAKGVDESKENMDTHKHGVSKVSTRRGEPLRVNSDGNMMRASVGASKDERVEQPGAKDCKAQEKPTGHDDICARSNAGEVLFIGGNAEEKKNNPNGGPSLQERFERFRRERMRERKLAQFNASETSKKERTVEFKNNLRSKFVAAAKKYMGVPYAAKYHGPESPHYNAELYLDCCGLVRRAVQDLQQEFGFKIGRWNQNYQFDTLPKSISFEELKPGDLVFVEGKYTKPDTMRKQKYDLVHVEIFLGGETGKATIGARHQRGVICIHDSYAYTSKSYEITNYYFKSLDTWLDGICTPAHPEHWRKGDAYAAAEAGTVLADASKHRSVFSEQDGSQQTTRPGTFTTGEEGGKSQTHNGGSPVFFVDKGNGTQLVCDAMDELGWSRLPLEYEFQSKFDLKWVQTRSQIDYISHQEYQLVNHIPNNSVITTKLGLLDTLMDHYGEDFPPKWFPQTYKLATPSHCIDMCKQDKTMRGAGESPVWILKPASANCGKGIYLIQTHSDVRRVCFQDHDDQQHGEEKSSESSATDNAVGGVEDTALTFDPSAYANAIAQTYLREPLLLQGRKFDMRVYALVACTDPLVVHFHTGYARLSIEQYTPEITPTNRCVHLTNASVQKRHPRYQEVFQSNLWSLGAVEDELVRTSRVEKGWCATTLLPQMKQIVREVFQACRGKLSKRKGYFDLFGFDFLLGDGLNLSLLEVNTNPALHLDNEVLEELLPGIVRGTLGLVLTTHVEEYRKGRANTDTDSERPNVWKGLERLTEESLSTLRHFVSNSGFEELINESDACSSCDRVGT